MGQKQQALRRMNWRMRLMGNSGTMDTERGMHSGFRVGRGESCSAWGKFIWANEAERRYYSEGLAEFIRLWLTDRKLAQGLTLSCSTRDLGHSVCATDYPQADRY